MYINNVEEELEINDNNLPFLSFIAKLLKRVSALKEDNFVVNRDYLENEAATALVLGSNLREDFGEYYDNLIDYAYTPEVVKNGAGVMSEIVTERMFDYFS